MKDKQLICKYASQMKENARNFVSEHRGEYWETLIRNIENRSLSGFYEYSEIIDDRMLSVYLWDFKNALTERGYSVNISKTPNLHEFSVGWNS